jgi:hypothetical protein
VMRMSRGGESSCATRRERGVDLRQNRFANALGRRSHRICRRGAIARAAPAVDSFLG